MDRKIDWNVFVGTMTGILKGVKITEKGIKKVKNLISVENSDKKSISCMNWGNKEENEVLLVNKDQVVRVYDANTSSFIFDKQLNCGEGSVKGIVKYHGNILTGAESGEIKLWDITKKKIKSGKDVINAGPLLERVCCNKSDMKCLATGGKENELRLWDLEKAENTFTAKNVRPDELQLRVPVWISDITFLPDSTQVAISSRHGHVRLYDPTSSFRRPVVNLHVQDQALTCIATSSREKHILVGSGTGHMFLVDLRKPGAVLNHYKGFTGSIKQIVCSPKEPYIVSVGLDRHVRVHNLNTKELIFKEYLQSRLTSVLLRSDFSLVELEEPVEAINIAEEYTKVEIKEEHSTDEEYEDLFKNMATVGSEKRKSKNGFKTKRKKQKV